jgi:U3 small nucleolar RNA-associated protein 22
MFQAKDYQNYRYFYKRAFYIAWLAAGIQSSKPSNIKLSFGHLNENDIQPILIVDPNIERHGSDEDNEVQDASEIPLRVQIIPTIPEDLFPADKILLGHVNIKNQHLGDSFSKNRMSIQLMYNASIQMDASTTSYLKLFRTASLQAPGFKDTCLLGRIWLGQRGFNSSILGGGFGNFEWASLVALLLTNYNTKMKPVLLPGYSSYQLFKATLQFLATRDLCSKPMATDGSTMENTDTECPLFFDSIRSMNILFKMTPWSYALLCREAAVSVKTLTDNLFDPFKSTFIYRPDSLPYRFDIIFKLTMQNNGSGNISASGAMCAKNRPLYKVLRRGLTDRVSLIHIAQSSSLFRKQSSLSRPIHFEEESCIVGIAVDAKQIDRTVDRGPAAEDKAACAAFRKFWGEKAELRRFQDGAIVETVTWPHNTSTLAAAEEIINYLLARHIGLGTRQNTMFSKAYKVFPYTHGVAVFKSTMDAFRMLENNLRALEGLPLQFRHILAASSQLSYSSVEVPISSGRCMQQSPAEVVIEFEGSTKWPNDLPALQYTKVAFLLKIAEEFEKSANGIHAQVGLEKHASELVNLAFLDISYPGSITFRLRIRSEHETTLLEQRSTNRAISGKEKEILSKALAVYRRDMVHAPTQAQYIQTLALRFPALSSAIRIMKKWLSSHRLRCHLPEQLTELIVAGVFLNPSPWNPPQSGWTGFLRSLFFLAHWNWRAEPLIVDLSAGELQTEDFTAIYARFEAWRRLDPAMNRVVLFVASNVARDGVIWTDYANPPKVVVTRMIALARAACQVVVDQNITLDASILFSSPTQDFDFVIHVAHLSSEAKAVRRKQENTQEYKNLEVQSLSSTSKDQKSPGFNAVEAFFSDLNRIYGACAMFFLNDLELEAIVGLWSPSAMNARDWRIRLGYSSSAADMKLSQDAVNEGKRHGVIANKTAILAEIARLGGDIVKKIEVMRS